MAVMPGVTLDVAILSMVLVVTVIGAPFSMYQSVLALKVWTSP